MSDHQDSEYEYFVTHDKCGESDGPFATYEKAKVHYEYLLIHDPDSADRYFIEEILKGEEE